MSDTASASLDLAAAMALRDAGRPAEAEAQLRAGGGPDAQALLAHVQLLQGKLAPAQATYEALAAARAAHDLARRRPQNGPVQFILAQVAGRLGRQAEALAACAAALAVRPDLPLWAFQGALQLERGEAPAAIFRDTAALRGFEAFLEAAVAAAGRGETLPRGWSPSV